MLCTQKPSHLKPASFEARASARPPFTLTQHDAHHAATGQWIKVAARTKRRPRQQHILCISSAQLRLDALNRTRTSCSPSAVIYGAADCNLSTARTLSFYPSIHLSIYIFIVPSICYDLFIHSGLITPAVCGSVPLSPSRPPFHLAQRTPLLRLSWQRQEYQTSQLQ